MALAIISSCFEYSDTGAGFKKPAKLKTSKIETYSTYILHPHPFISFQNMLQLDLRKIEKKMKAMNDMFMFAYNLKKFQLREKHPEWTERQLNHKAYELIEKGCR